MKRVPLSLTKDCRITFIGNLRFDSETIEKEQIFLVYLKKKSALVSIVHLYFYYKHELPMCLKCYTLTITQTIFIKKPPVLNLN